MPANNRITRVAVSSTPGRGRHVILETGNTSVNTGPPVIQGVTELQTLGAFSGTVSVDCPANGAGMVQDVSFGAPLAPGFPNAFTLTAASTGVILASCFLIALSSDPNLVVSCPALSLTFGTGLPTQIGSGTWSLRPQVHYQGPQINASVRCFSAAATSDVTLTFVIGASLIGVPAPA